jgi:prepilin-type N-terminal cleavage/methylation domain-containing protein/prepilin-type processing-associated H-X9-DG protein
MPRRKSLRAFSLVELLVVIAVVSVLLALVIPSLGRAREVSRQLVCASNVKTWGLVLTNYAADNKGKYPFRNSAILQVPGTTWEKQTNPYIDGGTPVISKPHKLFFCPEGIIPAATQEQWSNISGRAMEYGIFAGMVGQLGSSAPRSPLSVEDAYDQFKSPKVLLGDVNRWSNLVTTPTAGTPLHTTHANTNLPINQYPSGAIPGFIYNAGIPRGLNVAYVDGSVRWNRWERMDFTKYTASSGNFNTYMWDK